MTAKKYPVVGVVVFPLLSLIPSTTKFSHAVYFSNLGEIRQDGSGTMDAVSSALENVLTTEKNSQTGFVTALAPHRVIEAYAVTASVFCVFAAVFYLKEKSGAYAFMLRWFDGKKIFSFPFSRSINHEKCISTSQVHRRVKSSTSR